MRSRPGAALGYLEVLASAALWGSSGIFSIHLFRSGLPPDSVALLRPLLAVGFMVPAVALMGRDTFHLPVRAIAFIAVVGGLVTAAFQFAYQRSTEVAGVPATVALIYLAPALVAAASGPLLGEWPTRRRVLLAALSVVGVWLTVLGAGTGAEGGALDGTAAAVGAGGAAASAGLRWRSVGWGVLAGGAYAGYTLVGRYASPRWGSVATLLYSTAGACAFLAAALVLPGTPPPLPAGPAVWALLAVYALVTIVVATALFYDGLSRIEASRASIAATAEPVVAALLATVLLGQRLSPVGWIGLALVVAGVAGAYAGRLSSAPDVPGGTPPPPHSRRNLSG